MNSIILTGEENKVVIQGGGVKARMGKNRFLKKQAPQN